MEDFAEFGPGTLTHYRPLAFELRNRSSICTSPYRISSMGLWNPRSTVIDYAVPLLAVQMTSIHVLGTCLKFLFRPLGVASIVCDMMAGILLGNKQVGYFATELIKSIGIFHEKKKVSRGEENYLQAIFPMRGAGPLGNFATIGFMIFVFLLGVKMDPRMIYKSGRKSVAIGILGFVFPLILGTCTVTVFTIIFKEKRMFGKGHLANVFYYIAASQCMTTFPVVATLLTELKILNSELGRLALSSSMVSEVCTMLLLMIMIHFKRFDSKTWDQLNHPGEKQNTVPPELRETKVWLWAPLSSLIYVAAVFLMIRPSIRWVISQTGKNTAVKETYRMFFIVGLLVSGLISSVIGQHVLVGPFILGLAIPDGPPLGTTLVSRLESISVMLVPLFITISGLRTSLSKLVNVIINSAFPIIPFLSAVTTLGKVVGVVCPCLYFKVPLRDALALGTIMSAKGIVELSTYNVWRDSEILNDEAFSMMIMLVGINAAIVPYLVRTIYDPAKQYAGFVKRTILHSEVGTTFKVLACINEEDNVPTFIKLLQASNPTRESPVYVYMLHFLELYGRTAPQFLSHDEKIISGTSDSSQSEHFIKAFRNFEQQNPGMVNVEAFTSICPLTTTHEDICRLANIKCTVLVIIPFHKQWSEDGLMDARGKHSLRELNQKVLETAPCSVGILVDRGKRLANTSMCVGVLFLGGADDREALAYAKRMADSPSISITLIQLVASEEADVDQWDIMLDKEAVKDFKLSTLSNKRVVCREQVVKDGVETAWVVHSVENDHDLLLVGRRHQEQSRMLAGLSEWNECPELGEIGDMLASSDVKAAISVLVIQMKNNTIQ